MPTVEELWELVKKLPFEERIRLARRALGGNGRHLEERKRRKALEEFLNGPTFRWERTGRDEWHAR